MNSINFNIGGDNKNFVNVLKDTKARGARISQSVNKSFSSISFPPVLAGLATFGGATAAIAAFTTGIKEFTDYAGKMSDLSAKTGANIQQTTILSQVFKNAGLESGAFGSSINKLQKALAGVNEDGDSTVDMFAKLGIKTSELKSMDPGQQFQTVGLAIANLRTDIERTDAATKIFGKSGGDLLAIFKDPRAFETARQQVGGLGTALTANGESFDKFSDAIGALDLKKMQLFAGIAEGIAGDLSNAADAMNRIDLYSSGKSLGQTLKGGGDAIDTSGIGSAAAAINEKMQAVAEKIFPVPALLKGFNERGKELSAIEASDQAVFEREAAGGYGPLGAPDFAPPASLARPFDDPLKQAMANAPNVTRAPAIAVPKVPVFTPALRFSSLPSMTPQAPQTQGPLSTWQRLQNSPSSFQALQAGKIGDRTNATLGASPGLISGFGGASLLSDTLSKKNEAKKADRAERDKDKTPEGTNARLDKLTAVVEKAWE